MAKIDELKAKHGQLASVTTPDGRTLTVSKPSAAAFRRFTDRLTQDKGSKASAFEELVLACVVEPAAPDGKPDVPQAQSILADYPALTVSLAGAVQELGGSDLPISKS